MKEKFYNEWKGIYYKFQKRNGLFGGDVWCLSDKEDGSNIRANYNADKYRLDECLEIFKKELKG